MGLVLRVFAVVAIFLLPQLASAQATTDERERLLNTREEERLRQLANAEKPGIEITTAAIAPRPEEFCFQINEINLEGIESLPSSQVNELINPFVNSCMGQTAVDSILQVLTQAYLDEGLITSRAYLPEQDLASGQLTIVVIEGVIEDISFALIKDEKASPGKLRRFNSAFPTKPGKLLNLRDLEQGIDQINRVPSTQAQLDIAPGLTIGGSILQVAYAEEDKTRLRFTFGQTRRDVSYEQTASLLFETDNILGVNDTWFLGLSGSQTSNALSGSASIPYGYFTGTAAFNYSESVSQLTSTTELFEPATTFSFTGSYLLSRNDKSKTHLDVTTGYSKNERFVNGSMLTPQSFRTLVLTGRHEYYGEGSFLSLSANLTYGELAGDTSGIIAGSGPQPNFTTLGFSSAYQKRFQDGTSLYATLSGQYSTAPLFSKHQFSVGGSGDLRGINSDSISGDSGLSLTVEYSFPIGAIVGDDRAASGFFSNMQPYAFLDAGAVWNKDTGARSFGLGIGVGTKYYLEENSVNIYVGFPVKESGSLRSRGAEFGLNLSVKVF
jgi:hemolysin activation/secretion protein